MSALGSLYLADVYFTGGGGGLNGGGRSILRGGSTGIDWFLVTGKHSVASYTISL